MYHLEILGEQKEYSKGTTYAEIAWEYQQKYEHPILLASLNGRLRELFKSVEQDGKLEFITALDTAGHSTLVRGMIFVMMRAMYTVSGRIFEKEMGVDAAEKTAGADHSKAVLESRGGHMIERVRMEYSLGAALYGEIDWRIKNHPELSEFLPQVKEEMKSLIAANLPFDKKTVGTEEATRLFHEVGMYEKEKLFGYRLVSNTNIYELGGFYDYYYGYMPRSTGVLPIFDLTTYEDGFLLLLPERKSPGVLPKFQPRKKLYDVLQRSNHFAQRLSLENVGDLNRMISTGNTEEMILVQEAYQEKEIAKIAEQIYNRGNVKFVMIAGPTSSGKTTFSHRLSVQLRTLGLRPQPIAVDDYFVNREDTPLDENGNYNFEILEAIDVKRFNQDMTALLRGEKVELPTFNFKTGKREYKGRYKQLGAEDILVIEGIHGLNDALSYALPRESKFKIYISALTQLNVDEHNRIATTDGRLIRRMVRDARTRGTAAKDTIAMWPSVRRGEEENIFPFQEDADVMFNSALIYE
ncbi:MAG: nucleoside kinase, partial [Lachnospiraceae bacterium]|nr:nucleoside kinase [Lachnospiraceae bacterium]